jgi:hypothetical protein
VVLNEQWQSGCQAQFAQMRSLANQIRHLDISIEDAQLLSASTFKNEHSHKV